MEIILGIIFGIVIYYGFIKLFEKKEEVKTQLTDEEVELKEQKIRIKELEKEFRDMMNYSIQNAVKGDK